MDSYFRLQQLCNNCKTQPKFGFCIQFENFNGHLGQVPWTPSCIVLPVEPTRFAFSKMAHGKELWECSIDAMEILVSVLRLADDMIVGSLLLGHSINFQR